MSSIIWLIAKPQFDPLLPNVNFGTFSSARSGIYHNLPLNHRQKKEDVGVHVSRFATALQVCQYWLGLIPVT